MRNMDQGREAGKQGRRAVRALFALLVVGLVPACGNKDGPTPVILQVSPISGATGVPLLTPIFIYWDRPMDPTTMGGNFTVTDNLGGSITVIPYYNATQYLTTLVPSTPYISGRIYTVAVLGGVEDTNGDPYGGNSYSFTAATSTFSSAPSFTGSPTAVAGGAAGQIQINWTAAANTEGSNTTYNIYIATLQGDEGFLDPANYSVTQSTVAVTGYLVTGLTTGVPYYFVVEAVEASSGNVNWNPAEVSATAP